MSDISDIKIIINDRLELFKTELEKHTNFVDDQERKTYTNTTNDIARIDKSVGESIEEVVNVVNKNIEYNVEVLNGLITKKLEEYYEDNSKKEIDLAKDFIDSTLKDCETGEQFFLTKAKYFGLASLVLVSFVSAFYFFIWLYS